GVQGRGEPEGAVAVVQPDTHGVAKGARGSQVKPAVTVEIACRHRLRRRIHNDVPDAPEGAVAPAESHAEGVSAAVGRDYVEKPVAVEAPNNDRRRIWACPDVGGIAEGAVAISQADADHAAAAVLTAIRHSKIDPAIAIEVRGGHRYGRVADGNITAHPDER